MKIPHLSICLAAGLLAGSALAAGAPDMPRPEARGALRADKDGDGKVSRQEAATLRDQIHNEWFDRTDANKDGYLTEAELREARDQRHERRQEMKQHLTQRFEEADANHDGQLSLDEAQAKLPRLAERFTSLDTDKNGMLSKEELKRGGPASHSRD